MKPLSIPWPNDRIVSRVGEALAVLQITVLDIWIAYVHFRGGQLWSRVDVCTSSCGHLQFDLH